MNRFGFLVGRGLRLRTLLLLILGGIGLYVFGIFLMLTLRVGREARRLQRDAEPALYVFDRLVARAQELNHAVADAHMVVGRALGQGPEASAVIERVRDRALAPSRTLPFEGVPERMRPTLAAADEAVSSVQNRLLEVLALVELRRFPEAEQRLGQVDSLNDVLGTEIRRAEGLGLEDLLRREALLRTTIDQVTYALGWWIVLGIVLVPVVLWLLHQRLERPLDRLEGGLARVADGDLSPRLHVERDDELGRLAQHFNQMTRVLRERAAEQGRFAAAGALLADVAHEVNNPLMAIGALAESRLQDKTLPDDLREEIDQILRQSRRAGKLLSGLLRFVRPTDGRQTAIVVHDVVRGALDLVNHQLVANQIELDVQLAREQASVMGDPARMEQVFVNLLSNAIDAMRGETTHRRLGVSSVVRGGRIGVSVVDTGPGVSPELADQVFRPFVSTKGKSGTGLGLYISRQIVREMGGDLVLAPQGPSEGARFVATFPVALPEASAALVAAAERPKGPLPPVARPLQGVRVLLVEDEEAVRQPVARYLARRGATVDEAGHGVEAMARVAQVRPDVIVADLRMPVMDGMEFFRHLRATDPGLAERVLFLSGDFSQLHALEDLTIPADRQMLKPVDLDLL
ncbi:MAG TPA: ATP-binding protein, partial [Anaeromyxobacteraceae bacterium]|nr:ATP-binding protein [Anaeromyxobacteraceae bacterium]